MISYFKHPKCPSNRAGLLFYYPNAHQTAPVYCFIHCLQQTIQLKADQLSVLSMIGAVPRRILKTYFDDIAI